MSRSRTAHALACAVLGVGVAGGLGMLGWGLMPAPDAPLPQQTFDLRTEEATTATSGAARRGPATPVTTPARLRIPDLSVDAPLVREEVSADGELVVPGRLSTLGWWAPGEKKDPRGDVVVAGHVDMNGDLGALHSLSRIRPGAEVVLAAADGSEEVWRVDALEVRAKDALPTFSAEGERRMAIVTCGGPVVRDGHGRGYRDNVIAWASPVG